MSDEVKVPMNEAEVEETKVTATVEQPTVAIEDTSSGLDDPIPGPEGKLATKADTDACIEAVRELTKVIGELQSTIMKKLNAGKF